MKKTGMIIAVGLVAVVACRTLAEEVVLWPSDATVMRAQPDSSIASLADGALSVTTGVKTRWPGVRMDFASGETDLSRFGRITIALSNMTDRVRTVNVSVKGVTRQGQSPGGSLTLAPHAAGVLTADFKNMPLVLDTPVKFHGMRGYPDATGRSTFDLRRTNSFHIFLVQDGVESSFCVSRVTASTDGVKQKRLAAATFFPFVDRFGQFKHDDWPGKVRSEADLAAEKEREDAWLEAHAEGIPGQDRFGGWAEGPQLRATGFFRTEKVKGKWWLIDPDGHLFFSHGVDCVGCVGAGSEATGITHRERYFAWLPERDDPVYGEFWRRITGPGSHGFYSKSENLPCETFDFACANLRRKYGSAWRDAFQDRAHRRLRAWGLNTIANWSMTEIADMKRTPYTLWLHTGGTPRLKGSTGWWGPLPDPFTAEFERTIRERARAAAKRMRNDPWCVGVFVDNELSWNNGKRMADVAERYFSVVRRVLREELPNHLYLGCRIASSWGTVAVYRAAARHCDVVSVNIYDRRPVCGFPPDAEDKPLLVGEFHFGALDRGLFHTGLVGTRDQAERARCYRDYVNACLDHPQYVGTHWFRWQNEPLTGRTLDGENYQIGFIDVADTPYPELVKAARDVAHGMYRRRWNPHEPLP